MMNKVTRKTLSFVGGAIVAGAIAAVVVAKSPRIKAELERQSAQALETTSDLIEKVKSVVAKLQHMQGDLAEQKAATSSKEPRLPSPERQAYEEEWAKVL